MKKQSVRKAAPAANNRPAAVRIVPKPTGAMATAAAAARRKNGRTAPAAESALQKRAIKWRVRAEKWQHRPMMLRLEVAPTAQQNHSMRYSAPRPSPSGTTDH